MKVLIAISTCELFERNGSNSACRETWMADAARTDPAVDVRMFFGSRIGPVPGQVSGEDVCGNRQMSMLNFPDQVLLDCHDDYGHLTSKTQMSLRWAHAWGYDFVFRCFPDTYVRVERLMACGFEEYDWVGDFRGETTGWQNYASGGAGYMLSRKAYSRLLDEPITGVWKDSITPYAEDLWTGNRLGKEYPNGLRYLDLTELFINRGRSMWPGRENPYITSHLSCGNPQGPYRPEVMRQCHRHWVRSHREAAE